jgi:hypothetical protein
MARLRRQGLPRPRYLPMPRETGPISDLRGQISHQFWVHNRCVIDVTLRETARDRP